MSELRTKQDSTSERLYQLERADAVGVLNSNGEVVLQARSVQIEPARIEQLARLLLTHDREQGETNATLPMPEWPEHYHFFDGTERSVNWMLLLDAVNFCFWGEKGQARWQVDYRGEVLDGYWAEAAALRRAVEEGKPLWDARYLSNIDHRELATILRGLSDDRPGIPLFEERLRGAREVGQVLLERFEGEFSHLIEQVRQSGVELALALAEHFTSFRDVATYNDQEVRFLKRAQICVADLHGAFHGQSWGAFTDLNQLRTFANYKLPKGLGHHG